MKISSKGIDLIYGYNEPLEFLRPLKIDYLGAIMNWYAEVGRSLKDFDPEDIWNKSLVGWDNLPEYDRNKVKNVYHGFNVAQELSNVRGRVNVGKGH